jgi:LAO/AO transport system kinase
LSGGSPPDPHSEGPSLGRRLRAGDSAAAPAALNLIEDRSPTGRREAAALLAEVSPAALGAEARAHVIGLTGPPGAGKSSLLSVLVGTWRNRGRSVAVLAVDPSSRRSGGSLLGDRARIERDPSDAGVLIRSTAAGTRLGGLAPATREAAQALAAVYDVVVVETVGVGQSETDVEEVADTVCLVVQPGSGDILQFLKAGIMEVPDVLVVTKADLGPTARRAQRDLDAALRALGTPGARVLSVSSISPPTGVEGLVEALDEHRAGLDVVGVRERGRRLAAVSELIAEHGERPLRTIGGRRGADRLLAEEPAGASVPELVAALARAAGLERDRADGPPLGAAGG